MFGQAQNVISIYESVAGDTPWSPNIVIDDIIRNYTIEECDYKGDVLFPLIPGYGSHRLRFCILGHAFRVNGYEPIILRDDDNLPINTALTVNKKQKWLKRESIQYATKKYPQIFGFKTVSIGDVLEDSKLPDINNEALYEPYEYNGIDISKCASASTKKYLKVYDLDISTKDTRDIYKEFLRGAMLLADATENIIHDCDLEATIVPEASYIQGKIPMKLCEKAGIKAYTSSGGYHEGKLILGRSTTRVPMPQFEDEAVVSKAVETELSVKEKQRINAIMEKRETGDVTRVKYTPDTDSSVDATEKKIAGVFSHLLWDGALEPEQATYGDIYEWLNDTIEVGKEMSSTHFVIKAHPAEEIRGTNESVIDWIDEHHAPLPDNFTILPPDTDVDTYALIRELDIGLVYASTVGLEMAFNGIPVVTGGYPPYHGFKITHDPESKSEYRNLVKNLDELDCDRERKKRAQRFAYFLFICKHFDFPYTAKSEEEIEISHEEIATEDSSSNIIVHKILNGESVIRPDCMGFE